MTRTLRIAAVCLLAVFAAAPAEASGTARADKEGWWSSTGRTAPAAVPETVPKGAIGIAATGGNVTKVAAIGVVLDAQKDSKVERFTLTMKEASGTGAQQNSSAAAIVACPITGFFTGDENGKLADAPVADCKVAKSNGKRNDNGTWTFDLAAIANAWLDPFGTVSANGLRFDPVGGSFQVSLTGKEDAVFDIAISPPQEDANPFDSSATTSSGGFSGSGSSGSSGSDFSTSLPPVVGAPTTAAPVEGATSTPPTTEVAAAVTPAVSRAGETGGNLPGGVPVLVLVMIGGGVLIALALGPAGRQRNLSSRRAGGVSRALEARVTSNPGAAQ